MRRLIFTLLLLVGFVGTSQAQDEAPVFTLNLYHTNDEHAHHRPNRDGIGGVARLSTVIAEARTTQENVLLVDGGDRFSGTLFHYFYQGQDNVQVMNLLGYDAMVLGNHEFDNGSQILADFISGVNFPVLAANVDASADPLLNEVIQPYIVLEVGGEQVGVIGLVTPRTAVISQPEEGIIFQTNLAEITNEIVAELSTQGVSKVILLTHQGYQEDLDLAPQVAGVDAIIGGHTNTIPRPYIHELTNADGAPIVVVQAGSYSEYVGHLELGFDAEGVVVQTEGELIALEASIPENEEMVALLDELETPLAEITNKVIGQTAFAYTRNCYGRECDLGVLITDAMLEATGAQIAIINSGGIREDLPGGDVTYGDILSVLPFDNQVSLIELTGADVLATLEHGVSGEVDGKFPQVAGLRFTWSPSAPDGERIQGVDVWDSVAGTWIALDLEATYTVATNDFMRGGGDGYQILVDHAMNPYDAMGSLDQMVVDYIAAHSPVENKVEGRIK